MKSPNLPIHSIPFLQSAVVIRRNQSTISQPPPCNPKVLLVLVSRRRREVSKVLQLILQVLQVKVLSSGKVQCAHQVVTLKCNLARSRRSQRLIMVSRTSRSSAQRTGSIQYDVMMMCPGQQTHNIYRKESLNKQQKYPTYVPLTINQHL